MKLDNRYEEQNKFWENAGDIGYSQAMFSNHKIENHILTKQYREVLEMAKLLELNKNSRVLELGCGDGKFADNILTKYFGKVDAFDKSESAIARAKTMCKASNISFHTGDVSTLQFDPNQHWEAVFMFEFLHHVKPFAKNIISRISEVCPKIILCEPNGNNFIRKLLEKTSSYIRAGEDSFTLKELKDVFAPNGYQLKSIKRLILIPPFLPVLLFPVFRIIESIVEKCPILNRLCSTYILVFEKNNFKHTI